jgi:hypothetical protein
MHKQDWALNPEEQKAKKRRHFLIAKKRLIISGT